MPNTPMQVAEGCSLYCPGAYADEKDVQIIDLLLNSIGSAHKMEEKLIDAATGISGCGPAFVIDLNFCYGVVENRYTYTFADIHNY